MGKKYGLFRFADSFDKLLIFIGIVASIGEGMTAPMSMLVLSEAIDAFGTAGQSISSEVVNKYVLRLLYVALGVGFASFFEGLCWTRTSERQTSRMRMEYLKSILRQEVSFFDKQDASSTVSQVVSSISVDAHSIQDVIADKIPNALAQFSAFIIGIYISFLLSWRLALVSIPFAFGFIAPIVGFGKLMTDIEVQSKDAHGVACGIVEQAISNIRTVYSYVGEQRTVNTYSHALRESMNLGIKQGLMKGLMIGSSGMVFVTWAFQSWYGGLLITEKGEHGGHVFISGVCIILGGIACMTALPNVPFIIEAYAAAKRIFEMIDRVPEIDTENENGKVLENIKGEIEFREVYFCYPSRKDEQVLQALNLKVKSGQKVGLVGESGSGKSTIISLLERFYDPAKGDILLDGHGIKSLQLKWLRSQIGLVSQEPVLFAMSITRNILFGKEDASMELVIAAAKAANAHNFITKFPEGYDTQVGQLGVQLSGGQKQRIAIARALLRDPRILLLDEATSALDAQSESIVQEAIDQASLGRTTIIIAHRLTSIRSVNTIFVLEFGRIIESGSHDELLQINNGESGGIYSKMVRLQNSTIPSEPSKIIMQNSPGSYYSPTLNSISSIQNSPVSSFSAHYEKDEKLENLSIQSPSQWRLLGMNAPEWKRSIFGCLGAVLFGAILPVNAYCMGALVSVYFINDISKIKSETRFYSIMFLGVAAITFFSNLLQHYNFAIMGERLTKRIREKILKSVLTFEIGWFDQDENTSAAICARLSYEANMVRSLVGDRISLLVQVFANAFLSFVLAFTVTWKVSAVVISVQPLVIISFYYKTVLLTRMSENAQEAQSEGSQLASEAVVNHRTITAFSSQKRIVDLFVETLKGPRKESVIQSWISGIGLSTSQFLTVAAVVLTFWYGGMLMNKGELTSKQLFLAFFILMSTGKTIADAGAMTSDLSKGSSAVGSVFAILDRESKIKPCSQKASEITVKGKIELDNIFFSYPSRPNQMVFSGLSLKIEAGQTMALIGESGSGKSTVIGLIERFYDPIKGSVLIDDYNIKSYNLRDLRSHIALVSQEPALFAGTIYENIVYGRNDATEAEIMEAATQANAHEFISSMKEGYRTYCGERGVQLSGGQKQRIALARAILKNPSILLLDEATSALDSISETLVQETFEKMMVGRTCVIVAHRLSTIKMSDCIAVIQNGKVVERGSHSELLDLGDNGSYYSLIKLQHCYSPLFDV